MTNWLVILGRYICADGRIASHILYIYLYLRRKKKHRSILKQINQLATEELTYSRSTDDVAYTYNFCLFVCFGDDL